MPGGQQEVLHAYRHLYQHLLRAVKYAKPARFVIRERIRHIFRNSSLEDLDGQRIARTLEFLDGAAKFASLEHRILKNWVLVWKDRGVKSDLRTRPNTPISVREMYARFDHTVEKLNQTMGTCIK